MPVEVAFAAEILAVAAAHGALSHGAAGRRADALGRLPVCRAGTGAAKTACHLCTGIL